jgi:hypothetical protein
MGSRFKNHTPKTHEARMPSQEWERHKLEIQRLRADGSTVAEIVTLMEEKYGYSVQ